MSGLTPSSGRGEGSSELEQGKLEAKVPGLPRPPQLNPRQPELRRIAPSPRPAAALRKPLLGFLWLLGMGLDRGRLPPKP